MTYNVFSGRLNPTQSISQSTHELTTSEVLGEYDIDRYNAVLDFRG